MARKFTLLQYNKTVNIRLKINIYVEYDYLNLFALVFFIAINNYNLCIPETL